MAVHLPDTGKSTVSSSITPLFSTRVLPSTRAAHTVAPLPLVCIGSVTAPNATALVLYHAPAATALDPPALERSLSFVLGAYRQLAGRLRLTLPSDKGRPYTRRHLRTWMDYGRADDPGVSLVVESRSVPLSSIFPAAVGGYDGVLSIDQLNDPSLAPDLAAPLTAPERGDGGDAPTAGVKITRFACGGTALCFASFHTLFDAHALGTFLADWADVHNTLGRGETPTLPDRTFDPAALDALAEGDLDADAPDPALVAREAGLDVLRYDSWARDPEGKRNPPPEMEESLAPGQLDALDAKHGRVRGTPPPWDTASAAPVRTLGIEFSAADVEAIYAATKANAEHGSFFSAQDAFVAHLWRLIARARGQGGDTVLDCAMACDDRRRFDPPLPSTAPGCFNVCLGFQGEAGTLLGPKGAAWGARRIRAAIASTTAPVLAAWLHRRAHDLDPTREWILFPGTTTFCSTNWARSALYDLDFGTGKPAFVHNLVQAFGGYATIVRRCGGGGVKWYQPGVVVVLWLEKEAMERLLRDPELRGGGRR